MLNRRRFVYTLGGFIVLGAGQWRAATAAGVSLEGPQSWEVWAALVKDTFSLLLDNRSEELFLLRVDDNGAKPGSEQFTVTFTARRELILLDGTYRIAHATAGTTEVFLQPVGNDQSYNYYRASFNILRDPAGVQAPPRRDRGRGWRVVP